MIYAFFIIFCIALIWSFMQPSRVERCTQKALEIQSMLPISEEIQNRPQEIRSRFFQQSMELLWKDTSESSSKVLHDLCLFFVQQNPTQSSGHQWIEKMRLERPNLVSEVLLQNYDCTYLNKREAG